MTVRIRVDQEISSSAIRSARGHVSAPPSVEIHLDYAPGQAERALAALEAAVERVLEDVALAESGRR